jgi:plasmid rolling circle replication initiator protein Rep
MEFCNSDVSILMVSDDKKQSQFLSDVLPKTKKNKKDKSWDTHKAQNVDVAVVMCKSEKLNHQKQGKRISECCQRVEFGYVLVSTGTGEVKLRLKSAEFCRVRYCPICQWRRALMWVSRFFDAFPRIYAAHPEMRYIMLTLTVRNCAISELRSTVIQMAKAWQRLSQRKAYPALGFVRSLEVTRGDDDSAHPHFHILLAVPPSYFNGRSYLSKDKWAALWQDAMRLDYKPVCDVRIVKEKADKGQIFEGVAIPESMPKPLVALMSAITETIKYTTKPADMVKESSWLLEMVDQMQNIRAVALGGIFKEFLKETEDNQDLIETDIEKVVTNEGGIHFSFRDDVKRYQRFHPKTETEDYASPAATVQQDSVTEITAQAKFARDREKRERAYLAKQAGVENSQIQKPSAIEIQEQAIGGTSEPFACSDLADEIRAVVASGKSLKEHLELTTRKTYRASELPTTKRYRVLVVASTDPN